MKYILYISFCCFFYLNSLFAQNWNEINNSNFVSTYLTAVAPAERDCVKSIHVSINETTVDFLQRNLDYRISDFRNIEHCTIDSYSVFETNLDSEENSEVISKRYKLVIENWLIGIEKLEHLKSLNVLSNLSFSINKNVKNLTLFHNSYISSNFYDYASIESFRLIIPSSTENYEDFNFQNFGKIKSIWINKIGKNSNEFLNTLPSENELENLTIDYPFENFSKSFSPILPNLKTLQISSTQIKTFDFNILSICPNLTNLSISFDEMDSIIFSEVPFENLKILKICAPKLKRIPAGFTNLPNVSSVHLETAQLNLIAPEFFSTGSIEYLSIYKSNLTSLPEGIENLINCKYLDIELVELDVDFTILKNLKSAESIVIWKAREKSSYLGDGYKKLLFKTWKLKKSLPNTNITILK